MKATSQANPKEGVTSERFECEYIGEYMYMAGLVQGAVCLGITGRRRAVRNVSGCRWESDCRSRVCEFEPNQVPYFNGD